MEFYRLGRWEYWEFIGDRTFGFFFLEDDFFSRISRESYFFLIR